MRPELQRTRSGASDAVWLTPRETVCGTTSRAPRNSRSIEAVGRRDPRRWRGSGNRTRNRCRPPRPRVLRCGASFRFIPEQLDAVFEIAHELEIRVRQAALRVVNARHDERVIHVILD